MNTLTKGDGARMAPLDSAAREVIAAVAAAPDEDRARQAAYDAPMAALMRAGDLLKVRDVDFLSKSGLAAEVVQLTRVTSDITLLP